MYILLSENIIAGYTGDVKYPDSVFVEKEDIPANFFDDFDIGKWLYKDGKIVENPDFVPPEPEPEDEQLETQEMILDHEFRLSLLELGAEGGETA